MEVMGLLLRNGQIIKSNLRWWSAVIKSLTFELSQDHHHSRRHLKLSLPAGGGVNGASQIPSLSRHQPLMPRFNHRQLLGTRFFTRNLITVNP